MFKMWRVKFYVSVFQTFGLVKGILFFIRRKGIKSISLPNVAHPILLRPRTSDMGVFVQIFLYNEYEFKLGFVPHVIIDGGANIGLASVYFKNKYPGAKIIAVEPDAGNAESCRANVAKYNNVFVKEAGLWSKKTRTKISDKLGEGNWAMRIEELDDLDNEQNLTVTSTVTIADIMEEYDLPHIDLLKLDIETAEREVFSANYMSWLPGTKAIVIELHDWLAIGCSQAFFSAINEAFKTYRCDLLGENILIINLDLVTPDFDRQQ
jgi:FkbM family methyltransferase